MAFFLKGLGDPATRVNEILPRFDASIFNFLTQTNPGVCWWENDKFNATVADRGVNIGAGMVFCHGYFGMSDSTHRINFTLPASGTQFARIFAEVNLSASPHRFSIRATNQSTSSSIGLTQNNLSTNPSGIHQIPLYLITIPANGAITAADQRVQLNRLQNAQHAQTAGTATNANNVTGTIANAATATTQTTGNSTTRVATTAFVGTALNNRLARSSSGDGGIGSWTTPTTGLIFRWGESSGATVTFSAAFPNTCGLVAYIGHHGTLTGSTSLQSRDVGIRWSDVSRTGFTWQRTNGTNDTTRRKWLAIGW